MSPLVSAISSRWWIADLRGLLAIAFGVAAFARPALTVELLVLLFGSYALVDGVFALVGGLAGARHGGLAVALTGVLGMAIGGLTLARPDITTVSLAYLVGAWAIVKGALEIVAALRLRRVIDHEWLLGLSGALAIVYGVLMFVSPLAGAIGLVYLLGAYAIAAGCTLIAFGLRLRSLGHEHAESRSHGVARLAA